MRLLSDLQSRGLLAQTSDPDLDTKLVSIMSKRSVAAYAGFDPTSDSLHVGNFIAILSLMHAQRNGLRPIAIVGGATGLIGDPSGKTTERQLLTKEKVAQNVKGIQKVLERFLDFNHPKAPARIINNLDWFGSMSAIDFLRDVGAHFRIGSMLAKESVKARMEGSGSAGEGMSYTEFSYQLLQGYDFYKLYKEHDCVLQLGGSDQWGNITAGIDVIRRLEGESGNAFGVTMPLITTASGQKFGKSEGNAVWLSAEKTSPYDFHQFWLRVEDADVERYLKYFTFLPLEEIAQLAEQVKTAPQNRTAQRRLAELMTTLVHGESAAREAASAAAVMYGGDGTQTLDAAGIEALSKEVPSFEVDRAKLIAGWSPIEALRDSGLVKSGGEARRLIAQGGFYVNNQPWNDPTKTLGEAQLAAGVAVVLRTGKKNYRIARVRS